MEMRWQEAIDFCTSLNYAGHTDWRLPSVQELQSLLDYNNCRPALPTGHLFANVQSNYYWSSSSYANDTYSAWIVSMYNGSVSYGGKYYSYYVWPVRGGQFDSRIQEWQDRFTDNSDGTVTDCRTGLMWVKDIVEVTSGKFEKDEQILTEIIDEEDDEDEDYTGE